MESKSLGLQEVLQELKSSVLFGIIFRYLN